MTSRQSIWGMHLVALAWGSSAVFGAMISAPAQIITLGRCVTAVATLVLIFKLKPIKDFFLLPHKTKSLICIAGALIGIHWMLFFQTIKHGGVPLALITYASTSTVIAIGEVFFLGMKFRVSILIATILSFLGVYAIHPIESFNQIFDLGLMYGLSAALAISVTALVIKYLLTKGVGVITLSLNQLIVATLVSLPFALGTGVTSISRHDLFYIAVLGVICSALGQSVFNYCAKFVRMSSAAVIASMEVPYGIILAAIFLGQQITVEIVTGILLITASTVIVSRNPNSEQCLD